MKQRYTILEKVRILKPFMNTDEWYTSEKIKMMDATNTIPFCISTTLSILFEKGYLERKSNKRIYFASARRLHIRRKYTGFWAYRFKKQFLDINYEQLNLNLNYANCERKES